MKSGLMHKKGLKKLKQVASWVTVPGCGDRNQFPYRDNNNQLAAPTNPSNPLEIGQDHEANRWSFIPECKRQHELEALKERCHSLQDLRKFKYVVRPYGPNDYAALEKCKNCSSEFYLNFL
jgi:hypothetical protein